MSRLETVTKRRHPGLLERLAKIDKLNKKMIKLGVAPDSAAELQMTTFADQSKRAMVHGNIDHLDMVRTDSCQVKDISESDVTNPPR